MLHTINVNDEGQIQSSTVDQLANIDLTKDIVIVCPYYEKEQLIKFNIDGFVLCNNNIVKRDQYTDQFAFWPHVKMSVPKNIYVHTTSNIHGVYIIDKHYNILEGVNLDQELTIYDKILNISASENYYTLYNSLRFSLKCNDPKLFRGDGRFRGMQIAKYTELIKIHFLSNFIGTKTKKAEDIYIINYKLVYDAFPDFSKE